jgi:tRNA pseudouridine55 synthase
VEFFEHAEKAYEATLLLGRTTDTEDVFGNTLEEKEVHISETEFAKILEQFRGKIEQIPPMYSAVHVDGKRLYELARMGVEVERQPREVEIFDLTYVDRVAEDEYRFSVTCSSGTYIRTLCEDIAAKMGLCAAMSALRRTESNGFCLADAHTLEEVLSYAEQDRLAELAVSAQSAFSNLPSLVVPANGERYYLNGGALTANRFIPVPKIEGLYRAYAEDGRFLGLLSLEDGVAKAAFSADETF